MSSYPAGWLVPDWPAPAGVRAVCTTRAGGVSPPPFDTLNLGNHVGDDARNVAENRKVLADAIGARAVFMSQVHGTRAVVIGSEAVNGIEADACVTSERGIACTMMVADCMPVLFATREGEAVGAAHAGWRGLAGGVLENAAAALCEKAGCSQGELLAWLGPCIGPSAFEVGDEVRIAFIQGDSRVDRFFIPHAAGKWLADLPGLARHRLAAAGFTSIHGNDGGDRWCTMGNADSFFSYRRERRCGRFAAACWLA